MITYTIYEKEGFEMVAKVVNTPKENAIYHFPKPDAPDWLRNAEPGDMFDEQGNPVDDDKTDEDEDEDNDEEDEDEV